MWITQIILFPSHSFNSNKVSPYSRLIFVLNESLKESVQMNRESGFARSGASPQTEVRNERCLSHNDARTPSSAFTLFLDSKGWFWGCNDEENHVYSLQSRCETLTRLTFSSSSRESCVTRNFLCFLWEDLLLKCCFYILSSSCFPLVSSFVVLCVEY